MEIRVASIYKLLKKIDQGAFGEIYLAINVKNKNQVAVKFEPVTSKHPQLHHEAKIMNLLLSDQSYQDKGIPNIFYSGTEGQFNLMVMQLLGNNLQKLFCNNQYQFTIKTVLMLADQMLKRIQYVHSKQFVHRDIKPDNFAIGVGKKSSKIYLFDFGLAKKFTQKNGQHINYLDGLNLTGTARYASINSHIGIQQSRRDDLESMMYVLIYFAKGKLPWQGLKVKQKKEKYEKIKQKKMQTAIQVLCAKLPEQFIKLLHRIRQIRFDEKPDYNYIRSVIKSMMEKNKQQFDSRYDWQQKLKKEGGQQAKQQKK